MADVNEQIIEQYLKLRKKWFYMTDISFKVPRNYSNIDLMAFDPVKNKYYDIEVKFRSQFTIAANSKKGKDIATDNIKWLTDQFSHYSTREDKIREYIKYRRTIKVLVTTKQLFGKTEKKRKQIETAFKREMSKQGYKKSEIWYFDDIIRELYKSIDMKGRYNTELLQTMRMIKVYKP